MIKHDLSKRRSLLYDIGRVSRTLTDILKWSDKLKEEYLQMPLQTLTRLITFSQNKLDDVVDRQVGIVMCQIHDSDFVTAKLFNAYDKEPYIFGWTGLHCRWNPLSDFREIAGMTQAQLAEKSGISIKTIQAIETGARNINNMQYNNLCALANALDCYVDELIPLTT